MKHKLPEMWLVRCCYCGLSIYDGCEFYHNNYDCTIYCNKECFAGQALKRGQPGRAHIRILDEQAVEDMNLTVYSGLGDFTKLKG